MAYDPYFDEFDPGDTLGLDEIAAAEDDVRQDIVSAGEIPVDYVRQDIVSAGEIPVDDLYLDSLTQYDDWQDIADDRENDR